MPGAILCQVLFCCSPKEKCSPASDLHLCSWSQADVPRQRSSGQPVPQCLSLQACPHPYHTFCPHIPQLCSPISLHRLVQTCYSINQIPPTQSQLDASLCMPLGPYPAQAGAQKVQQGGAQSRASEEGPPQAPVRAGFQQETSFADKALDVVAGTKLIISQQCALVTNGLLDCFRSFARRAKKLILHREHCVRF